MSAAYVEHPICAPDKAILIPSHEDNGHIENNSDLASEGAGQAAGRPALSDPFIKYMHTLQGCATYAQLQLVCQQINDQLSPFNVHPETIFMAADMAELDKTAQQLYPHDVTVGLDRYACKSMADGNSAIQRKPVCIWGYPSYN